MSRAANGWIVLIRDLLFSDIMQRGPNTLWVWIRILLMANWKESSVCFNGQQIKLEPGQLMTGLKEIGGGWVPNMTVQRTLNYLALTGRIRQTTGNQGRLITICKWYEYQVSRDVSGKQAVNDRETTGKRPVTYEQRNQERNKQVTSDQNDAKHLKSVPKTEFMDLAVRVIQACGKWSAYDTTGGMERDLGADWPWLSRLSIRRYVQGLKDDDWKVRNLARHLENNRPQSIAQ